jgi:hypothetical protein
MRGFRGMESLVKVAGGYNCSRPSRLYYQRSLDRSRMIPSQGVRFGEPPANGSNPLSVLWNLRSRFQSFL